MSATIEERRLGETPWIIVAGERSSAFRLLGERYSHRIHAVAAESNAIRKLQTRVSSPRTNKIYTAVREESQRVYPTQWSELVAMAEGAQIPLDNLALLNLRGDLGTDDRTGCTDLAFRDGDSVFLAHNEDGAPEFEPYCTLLTLRIDGEPAVTTWWYPGFLPSNTMTFNEYGLVWGIDNVRVAQPAPAPGRHFVARALQSYRTITEVIDHLRDQPSAGGFAYTIGQFGYEHAIQIEAAAGHYAYRCTKYFDNEVLWHTNHLIVLPSSLDSASANSLTRAETATNWRVPRFQPVDWCLDQLARSPMPQGVRRDATRDDNLVTLVTFVVDFGRGQVTVAPRSHPEIAVSAAGLLDGYADWETETSALPRMEKA